MAKHAFSKDNQPNGHLRGKRGPEKRTLILDAIRRALPEALDGVDAEAAFYDVMVRRALNLHDKDSGQLLKELFSRLAPSDKSTLPAIEFPFREGGSPAEKIEDVQSAVAAGILPVDMGNTMVSMIVAGIKVFEVTEMAERLARIEQALNGEA
jgi:hypothetical protein